MPREWRRRYSNYSRPVFTSKNATHLLQLGLPYHRRVYPRWNSILYQLADKRHLSWLYRPSGWHIFLHHSVMFNSRYYFFISGRTPCLPFLLFAIGPSNGTLMIIKNFDFFISLFIVYWFDRFSSFKEAVRLYEHTINFQESAFVSVEHFLEDESSLLLLVARAQAK